MVSLTPLNTVLDRMVTLSRAMDEAFSNDSGRVNSQPYWVPAFDAWETDSAFVVQADLPGLNPEQVDISFDKNTLTIRGTRPTTVPAPDKNGGRVYFAERAHGTFARSLRFPQYVEGEKIEAKYDNGVLTITVPKAEAAKPRKIAIAAPVNG